MGKAETEANRITSNRMKTEMAETHSKKEQNNITDQPLVWKSQGKKGL